MAFYLFGALGLVWVAFWMPNVSDDPATDRHITPAERALLGADRELRERVDMPWRRYLTAPAVWAIFVAHFCNNWALYLLISWLPSYFREQLGLSITNAGLFAPHPGWRRS